MKTQALSLLTTSLLLTSIHASHDHYKALRIKVFNDNTEQRDNIKKPYNVKYAEMTSMRNQLQSLQEQPSKLNTDAMQTPNAQEKYDMIKALKGLYTAADKDIIEQAQKTKLPLDSTGTPQTFAGQNANNLYTPVVHIGSDTTNSYFNISGTNTPTSSNDADDPNYRANRYYDSDTPIPYAIKPHIKYNSVSLPNNDLLQLPRDSQQDYIETQNQKMLHTISNKRWYKNLLTPLSILVLSVAVQVSGEKLMKKIPFKLPKKKHKALKNQSKPSLL